MRPLALHPSYLVLMLILAAWGLFCLGHAEYSALMPVAFLFAVTASLVSYAVLSIFGYFSIIRLYPRKSDLLLVLLALPLGGVIGHSIVDGLLGTSTVSLSEVLLWAPALAGFVFWCHHLTAKIMVMIKGNWKVVLDLLPREHALIEQDLDNVGLLSHLTLLDRKDLEEALQNNKASDISLIIISRNTVRHFDQDAAFLRAHLAGIPVLDYQQVATELSGRVRVSHTDVWSYVLAATPQTPLRRFYSGAKNLLEPLAAILLTCMLSPLLLAVAALIKATSKGAVLYRQERVGYQGKTFQVLKFRSMHTNAEQSGPQWCKENDSRITVLGRFLRRTRLDEVPQLWNVIRGEMGFFGPRPERPEMYEALQKEIPLFGLRTVIRPGLTGWAQISQGYAASAAESKTKLEYDLYYIQHMSPRLDLIIAIKTITVSLLGTKTMNVLQFSEARRRSNKSLHVVNE